MPKYALIIASCTHVNWVAPLEQLTLTKTDVNNYDRK